MYCPNCGSNNQPEVKFCTRCGTNLAIVSDALSVKADRLPQTNEQRSELLKRYYSGRHKILLGMGSLAAGVGLTALLLMSRWAGFFWIFFWLFLGLFGYGAQNFTKGWNEWSDSSSKLKALGDGIRADDSPQLPPKDSSLKAAPRTAELLPADSSNVGQPPSITEATTRHLDAKEIEESH